MSREVVRYERDRPGELLHLDVKKLGRIPPGGGKRFAPGFAETRSGPRGKGGGGLDYVHVAIDDRSRYAYAEALPDERGQTTAEFLGRAIDRFAGLGVRAGRVLTDNGGNYPAGPSGRQRRRTAWGCGGRGRQDPAGRVGVPPSCASNGERLADLPVFLQEYDHARPHARSGRFPARSAAAPSGSRRGTTRFRGASAGARGWSRNRRGRSTCFGTARPVGAAPRHMRQHVTRSMWDKSGYLFGCTVLFVEPGESGF